MSILEAVVLGAIEGITEFLPVSSTAHLLFANELLGIARTEFVKSFVIAIQLGAILAVAALYFRRLLTDFETVKRVIAAFLPTALLGFLLYPLVKGFFLEEVRIALGALLVFGLFLIAFERAHVARNAHNDLAAMPYRTAFWIGCAQALAMVPGVSRSGATIVAGLLFGLTRTAIVEFSFLLAVPTMLAATGYDLLKSASAFRAGEFELLALGFASSFLFAFLAVKFFLSYISRHSFEAFGWYRVAAAALLAALLLA